MAEVWLADDIVLDRRVAVKILYPHLASDPVFLERFRSEARVAARLSHPGIVSIFDTVSEPDIEAIVMELLEGIDLRAFLDENGPLSPQLTRELGTQVADAIHAAHQAGLVHRDIKPGNIMLVDDRRMKVTDFGIAKPTDGHDLTDHGTMLGTVKYLAPEQVEGGPIDGRADVYALGVVLFECLTGAVPFIGENSVSVAMARLQRDPPHARSFRTTVPPSLDAVVHRAMARQVDERYATAADLRSSLLAADDATVLTEATGNDETQVAATAEPVTIMASERRWIVPTVLILIIAITLTIAGTLIGTTDVGRDAVTRARDAVGLGDQDAASDPIGTSRDPDPGDGGDAGSDGQAEPVRVVDIATFDPEGSGTPGENDSNVGLAIDGDTATTWATEGYDTRAFGGLKSGVGVVVRLNQVTALDAIQIDSPSSGWAAELYLADTPASTLTGWGSPITSIDNFTGGTARVDLGEPQGAAVLVWFTDLGDAPPRVRIEIAEIRLFPA